MRYLSTGFATGALRRGRSIEQFLGPCNANGVAGVRWIEIRPVGADYQVILHEVMDIDEIGDMYEFPALVEHDEEYFGEVVGHARTEAEAISLAAAKYGASEDRWVNEGVAASEYHDLVTERRRA